MNQNKNYKVCFNCGNFVHESEKDVYCSLCGNLLKTECPECEEKLYNPFARFCPSCGTPLVSNLANKERSRKNS